MESKLKEVMTLFLKLGFVSFGGPMAHLSMMENEVVGKRGWLTREHFLKLVSVANLMPGPTSTEMALFWGYIRAGLIGLLLSGICFILPAILITGVIAWMYASYGSIPTVEPFLIGRACSSINHSFRSISFW